MFVNSSVAFVITCRGVFPAFFLKFTEKKSRIFAHQRLAIFKYASAN